MPLPVNTRLLVSFHSHEVTGFNGTLSSGVGRAGLSGEDAPAQVVGFTSQKMFGPASGTWTLQLKPTNGQDLLHGPDKLWDDPEDVWVRIAVMKNGVTKEAMSGLVNTMTESMMRSDNGTRIVTYSLAGQDAGKPFDRTELFVNMWESAGTLPTIAMYDGLKDNIQGRPNQFVKGLIDTWLGNNGVSDKQWKLPGSLGGGYYFDALNKQYAKNLKGFMQDPTIYDPKQWMGRNLWDSLQEYSNGLLNEMYVDVDPDQEFDERKLAVKFVLRERPFPTNEGRFAWENLRTIRLLPEDVQSRNMTKGSPESRFNYWLIDGSGLYGQGMANLAIIQNASGRGKGIPGSAPIYDIESMRRHGFRRWLQTTKFLPFRLFGQTEEVDDTVAFLTPELGALDTELFPGQDPWFEVAAGWLHMLHDWYSVAPLQLSGDLTTTSIFPDFRIGERLEELRRDGSQCFYYVEGVEHQYTYPNKGSTTLTLTRGEFVDEDLLATVYSSLSLNSLDSALISSTELLEETGVLADVLPTGSGVQLDKTTGQLPTPEAAYLEKRGLAQERNKRVRAGELADERRPRDEDTQTLAVSDLPDLNIAERLSPIGRENTPKQTGGNLSQRELERGTRLRGADEVADKSETTGEGSDDYLARRQRAQSRKPRR